GLGATEQWIDLDEHDLRHEEPEAPRQLPGDDLGDERLRALSCTAELDDVQAVVVRLHDARQRAALAERGDVAGGSDRAHARSVAGCGRRPPHAIVAHATKTTGTMDDTIRRALQRRNIIDITTTGRRTGEPRRLEIVFHSFDGRVYISGMPSPRKRAWIANLEA